ncbi:MAG: hypothetical protein HKN18_08340 [Silicimonas sp.]|nr:hypothetical protein [Silicimonas sp.]
MSDQNTAAAKPDAFKARMAEAQAAGRPELAHQSLGRALSEDEHALADALMEAYSEGAESQGALAKALTAKGVARPSSGTADWTAKNLGEELKALNTDLDQAYQDHGFGA